jgi:mono/diheme cytochrome c family protein
VLLRISLLLLVAAVPATAQQDSAGSGRSVAHGVYSEDQSTRGKTVFEMHCASCHEKSFHTGEQFRMGWFGRSVADLFKTLKTTMPEDNIGGLSDEDYTRVIAYIFKLNGFPAGTDSLPADTAALRKIRIGTPAAGK